MKYEDGERDLVMLQHKFVVEWADGKTVRAPLSLFISSMLMVFQDTITSTLESYGSPKGHSAMALTVGLPCGIATQLILDGKINTPGILAPYTTDITEPIREILESHGVGLTEKVL